LASKSEAKAKGFFGDLAKGVASTALSNSLGVALPGSQQYQQMQMQNNAAQQQQAQAQNLVSRQRVLDKKMQKEVQHLEDLQSKVDFMKDEGLLGKDGAAKALEAPASSSVAMKALAEGKPTPFGGALDEYEAPIIFLEPPPVSPSQLIEASEESEATLSRLGDTTSPLMAALKAYEEKKLGRVNANSLEEVKQSIRETKSMITKRQVERENLVAKLKESGAQLAKTGNKRFQEEATFAKNDLKEKDKELEILANKLAILKRKEKNLLGAKADAAEEDEDAEDAEDKEDEEDEE